MPRGYRGSDRRRRRCGRCAEDPRGKARPGPRRSIALSARTKPDDCNARQRPMGLRYDRPAIPSTKMPEEGTMPGEPVHFEIPADDTAKGREFWGSLFGWQFESFPGPFEYHIARISDRTGAAITNMQPGKRGIRSYF